MAEGAGMAVLPEGEVGAVDKVASAGMRASSHELVASEEVRARSSFIDGSPVRATPAQSPSPPAVPPAPRLATARASLTDGSRGQAHHARQPVNVFNLSDGASPAGAQLRQRRRQRRRLQALPPQKQQA